MNESAPKESALIKIWVQPGSSREEIEGFRDGFLRIRLKAPAERGEANKACQKIIAAALKISPSQIKIMRGEKSRRKLIKISGIKSLNSIFLSLEMGIPKGQKS